MDASTIKALMARLNKNVTKAMEAAAGTCIQRAHYEITAEHCLLKLLDQRQSDIATILGKLTISTDEASNQLEHSLDLLKDGNHAKPKFSSILLETIGAAWNFANLERGETRIRSAHLLVALLRDDNWLASTNYGFMERLNEAQLIAEMDELTVGSEEAERLPGKEVAARGAQALEAFTVNLVDQAKNGEIDPVIGRDREIYQLVDILSRRRKNNPILVGDPGVGKSAIVEGLALLIAEGKAPPVLQKEEIRTLDLGMLKAGASMKGEFEERLKQVIDAVQNASNPIILFIDEAHTLIGAGGQAGSGDAANLLKPALARGKLRTIAATTWSEFKKYIEKDPALERRFQPVKVEEPDAELAAMMLRGLKHKYSTHHGIEILDSALEAAAQLSDRYITGRQLPDKAIDLLDTACARVRLSLSGQPYELTKLENLLHFKKAEIDQKEKEEKLTGTVPEGLERVRQEVFSIQKEFDELKHKWERETALVKQVQAYDEALIKGDQGASEKRDLGLSELKEVAGDEPLVSYRVTATDISNIVSSWTGIPVGKMMRDSLSEILQIEKTLKKRVLGQDHVADRIGAAIKTSKARVNNPETPIGVFLCVGPSGTGKTEMALALAETLFGGERYLIQINMSEYQEKHTVSRLIGSPPGYVGFGEGGVLTEAVRQRPYSVVLLDEVEKGHPDVMNLFYQVFDKGHCADGEGRLIDFKNTVVMMTSNLGSAAIEEMCAEDAETHTEDLLTAIRPDLNRYFKPALLARMTAIPYKSISAAVMKRIVGLKLRKVALRLKENHDLNLKIEASLLDSIADRCKLVEAGARNIDHILNSELLPQIAEHLLKQLLEETSSSSLTLSVVDEQFQLNFQ